MSTPGGRSRIESVAGGQFNLAIVSDSETTLREVAGIELHLEPLHLNRFVSSAIHRLKLHGQSLGFTAAR